MKAFAVANNNFGEAHDWESLCRLYTCDEDSLIINHQDHLLLQQFSSYTNPNPNPHPHPFSDHLVSGTSNVVALDAIFDDPYSFFNCLSPENSSSTESDQAAGGVANGFLHDALIDQSMCRGNGEYMAPPMFPNDAGIMLEEMCLQLKTDIDSCQHEIDHHAKRKHEKTPGLHNQGNEIPRDISAKKKPRIPRDAQKSKRNLSPKFDKNGDENTNVQSSISSSSSTSDENDCSNNASNPKANKGSKGPATDPQSLYARRRRERINERLRILQNLVPNGTKVDISTMLEEAVDYVKFLQLQIKLLSSDDMWMYAPIAYSGMDIGLYQKVAPNPCPQN